MLFIMTLVASLACVMHERHSDHHSENNSMDLLKYYIEKQSWYSVQKQTQKTMAFEWKSVLAQLILPVYVFTSAILAKPQIYSMFLSA